MATCTCSNCFSEDVCKYNDGVNLYCKGFCPHFTPKSDYIKRKRGEWVSVKDRLPRKDGKYLCYCSYGENIGGFSIVSFARRLVNVDKYDFANKYYSGWYGYDSEWGFYERDMITHWQPLPEPPKGE